MVDTRPRAYEKARRRAEELRAQRDALQENSPVLTGKPPGAGFESERQRAKNALRDELDTYDGTGVHKIIASAERTQENRILNVAAYCRVSTDDIEQTISIELQKRNYREMIRSNPKWKFAGLYVDNGLSGTETLHRPGFQRMMKDAMAGKIDMIVTKSVSRFARNLIDCISWVRRLKEQDPPVAVLFEQENLNTLDSTSNIILFVLAMVAEEESHMKSEAMLLSLEWRFSRGRFLTPRLLGYDKIEVIENGIHRKKLVINEEQAQTVRLMLAVRPCSPEHPNALCWATDCGSSVQLGARAFCTQLFGMLNWDESYTFRVPAMLRARGDEKALFFDLDNYIGHDTAAKPEAPAEVLPEIIETEETESMQGFFYAADEDEGIEITDDPEDIERRVREQIEREKRTYGTPAFEHSSGTRIPMIDDDGEWDITAEAVVLDSDHTVDAYTIETLQDAMMEELFEPAGEPDEEDDGP